MIYPNSEIRNRKISQVRLTATKKGKHHRAQITKGTISETIAKIIGNCERTKTVLVLFQETLQVLSA